jgi:PAB-dependent poly(A)-specific ribonuclease subunit 2
VGTTTIDAAGFAGLCCAAPLQGPGFKGPWSFKPLDMVREAPGPGSLVALDAEFVALSRPETSFEAGQEMTLKSSR